MSDLQISKYWFVVVTRPRWEKKIARSLSEKGVENYCPVNKVKRRWKDRSKIVLEPLFRGYVFVHIKEEELWEVKNTPGIINYVYHEKKPAKVRNEEIDTIRKFLKEFEYVEVMHQKWEIGQMVKINSGVMMDYKGIVLNVSGNKAKVFIQSMNIQLSATFELSQLSNV